MKKILKSRLFFFILGAVIFGTGSVFAYSILAPDVGYTPKDNAWEVDNVKSALDDLYTLSKDNIIIYETGEFSIYLSKGSYGYGNITLKRTYTLEDKARIFIYDMTPNSSPIYPLNEYSTSYVTGNTFSRAIVNYAGSTAYSRTYTFKYVVIKFEIPE